MAIKLLYITDPYQLARLTNEGARIFSYYPKHYPTKRAAEEDAREFPPNARPQDASGWAIMLRDFPGARYFIESE